MQWSLEHKGDTAIITITTLALITLALLWWQGLRDKEGMVYRVLWTLVAAGVLLRPSISALNAGGIAQIAGLLDMVCFGLAMAFIWGRHIAGYVGNLFGGLYDGGGLEVEAKPFYSIFRAKRNKGKYFEALAEVRRQLEKFPDDFEGHNLLAELQAENLNDLPGAEVTTLRLCAQPGQPAANIAYSLNRLADWHLGLIKDREAAQRALEKIMEFLPNTEMASRAAQRIAHLADAEMLLSPHDRERHEVKKGIENLGLVRGENGKLRAPEVDLGKMADEYVKQLEEHPLDTHAREQLAILYAGHFHRLDLAVEQLEQLIAHPGQTARLVTRWLNIMADLQVKAGAPLEQAQATLQRIIDLNPGLAAGDIARRRLSLLKLELKGQEKLHEVQLGTYEQNLGLKRKTS